MCKSFFFKLQGHHINLQHGLVAHACAVEHNRLTPAVMNFPRLAPSTSTVVALASCTRRAVIKIAVTKMIAADVAKEQEKNIKKIPQKEDCTPCLENTWKMPDCLGHESVGARGA